jgi:energy-coupling factor transport system ATP-binding protein
MIEFNNVSVCYPGESRRVLKGLSFVIPDEGITAIMGANGSGKSTAALCMNRILLPESGDVLIDGRSTTDGDAQSQIRRSVGIVFQNPHNQFTSLTVERELAFGLENTGTDHKEMKVRVEEYLTLFELDDVRSQLPASLSGGEKQRVAVAAVAIMEPKYLVLDEATSLLSPQTRKTLLHLIAQNAARRRTAVVLITQFPAEAMLADRLLIFNSGTLIRQGPPDAILRESELLRSLGVQTPLGNRVGLHER